MPKGNPQLENGFARIANELLEAILKADLGKHELLVTFALVRQTYGYSRKMAPVSLTLFASITGLERRNVAKAINSLVERDLVGRRAGAKMKYGKPVYNYWLNKSNWCICNTRTGVNTTPVTGVNRTPIKERNKILKKGRKDLVDKLTMSK